MQNITFNKSKSHHLMRLLSPHHAATANQIKVFSPLTRKAWSSYSQVDKILKLCVRHGRKDFFAKKAGGFVVFALGKEP